MCFLYFLVSDSGRHRWQTSASHRQLQSPRPNPGPQLGLVSLDGHHDYCIMHALNRLRHLANPCIHARSDVTALFDRIQNSLHKIPPVGSRRHRCNRTALPHHVYHVHWLRSAPRHRSPPVGALPSRWLQYQREGPCVDRQPRNWALVQSRESLLWFQSGRGQSIRSQVPAALCTVPCDDDPFGHESLLGRTRTPFHLHQRPVFAVRERYL